MAHNFEIVYDKILKTQLSHRHTISSLDIEHNGLQSMQGGKTGEYYHLTQLEHSSLLTTINNSHTHSNKGLLDLIAGTNTGDNTFSNGLTETIKSVTLGGDLTADTDINASANNYYLRFINRSNGSYFGVYRDANGGNNFILENPNSGVTASSTLRFINDLGITSQILNSSSAFPGANNSLIIDKISGDIIHTARSGKHRFFTNGFFGTERLRIDDNGVTIGNVIDGTHYTLPQARGTNNQVLKTDANGIVSWQADASLSDHAGLSNLDYASSNHTGFQASLGYTPEDVANKVTSFQATPDDIHYPSEKLVKDSLDAIDESKWQEVSINVPYNYGYLYNWYAVNTGKLAPTGYTVPTNAEFSTLENYLGGTSVAGAKLKSDRTDPSNQPRWEAGNTGTNDVNFNAIPSGYIGSDGTTFYVLGEQIYLWTSTESAPNAFIRFMPYNADIINGFPLPKTVGMAVRFTREATEAEQLLADGTYLEDVADADGNYYKMVKIGTQVWSTQNLKTTHYNDGAAIPNLTADVDWAADTTGAYCSYNNLPLSTYEDPTFYYTVTTNLIEPKNSKQVLASTIEQTSSYRFVTDTEKNTWNGKQDALGFTPENVANKVTSFQATPDDIHYPSEKLVKDNLDLKAFETEITGEETAYDLDFDTMTTQGSAYKTFINNIPTTKEGRLLSARVKTDIGNTVTLSVWNITGEDGSLVYTKLHEYDTYVTTSNSGSREIKDDYVIPVGSYIGCYVITTGPYFVASGQYTDMSTQSWQTATIAYDFKIGYLSLTENVRDISDIIIPLKGQRLVVDGDSIMSQGLVTGQIVAKTGCVVFNQAVSGTGYVYKGATNLLDRATLIASRKPNYILLAGGTNDWSQDIPLGSDDVINDDTQFYSAVYNTFRTIRENNLLVPIYVCTPIQRYYSGEVRGEVNSLGYSLLDYCNVIKRCAEVFSLNVIDLYAVSGITYENIDDTTADGLHPNGTGGILMADVIIKSFAFSNSQGITHKHFDIDHNTLINTHNLTTDIEISTIADIGGLKATWSGKQDALGFTPEDVANKENTTLDNSTTKYPTNNLTKNSIDSAKAFAVAMACAL